MVADHTRHPQEGSICLSRTLQGGDVQSTEAANNTLGVDETSEWFNSFFLVLKGNGKVWVCLDPARLNKVLIRPVHKALH